MDDGFRHNGTRKINKNGRSWELTKRRVQWLPFVLSAEATGLKAAGVSALIFNASDNALSAEDMAVRADA